MLRPRPGALIQLIAPRPDAAAIQRRATPTFPLEFTEKRRGVGYYIALAVVFSVFGITPLCFLWVIAYALRSRKWDGWMGVWAFGGFAYSVAEVLFYFYLQYITQIVQQPAPPSKLTPEQCRLFFVKMLQIGMQDAEGSGTQGGSEKDEDIPSARDIQERLEDVISLARTGQLDTKRDHIHPHPQQQAAMNAPSAVTPATTTSSGLRNRFGHPNKLTQATRMSDPVADGVQSPIIRLRRLEKDDPRAIAFREKMRNWFGRVPWDSITRTDVLHWLAWSCCNLPYDAVSRSPAQMALLEASVEMLEARTGTTFTDFPPAASRQASSEPHDGKAGTAGLKEKMTTTEGKAQAKVRDMVKLMRLTLDPVNTRPRPLFIYALRAVAESRMMRTTYRDHLGFQLYREGDVDYLLRLPSDWTPEKQTVEGYDPILFLHGLGFGLVSIQNKHVLETLVQRLPHNPIIVPIQPHISMHVFHPRHLKPPERGEMVSTIKAICKRWGFWTDADAHRISRQQRKNASDGLEFEQGQAATTISQGTDAPRSLDNAGFTSNQPSESRRGIIVFSHSNGSIAHKWLVTLCPEMILKNAFVDPVVFCLWEGDVCYNFCYRKPRTAIELLLHWFIASEIGIANSIQRHFDWSTNTLFHDEIPHADDPARTLVVLGGEDVIIDAWRVKGYLNRHGMHDSLVFDPLANHGEGLRGESLDRIVAFLQRKD